MARQDSQPELIGEWSLERNGSEVLMESVLLPPDAHHAVTQQFPELTYTRRNVTRLIVGPLAVDTYDRTRFVAVQDIVGEAPGFTPVYVGNAMLSHSRDVYNPQMRHVEPSRRMRAAVGFRLSASKSVLSSLRHGDNHALITGVAVAKEGDPYERRQYASIAVLSMFKYLAHRKTLTTVSAAAALEVGSRTVWEDLRPDMAGLPLHPDANNLHIPISIDAVEAYRRYRQYLVKARILGSPREEN